MKSFKLLFFFAYITSLILTFEIGQASNSLFYLQKSNSTSCTQTISGTISSKKTLLPIANALVSVYLDGNGSKITKTNGKGEYSIALNCNTNYKIIISAKKYFKSTYKFKTSSKKNEVIRKSFPLAEECYQTISGKIINELSKEIIYKATATLYLNGEENNTLKVDDDGNYTFKVKCNSNYYIKAKKNNFTNAIFEFETSNKKNKIYKHDFVLEPECIQTISGTILNKKTNEPVSSNLKLFLNNVEVETIKVGNNGKYFIKFQCTTNYRIVASKPNFENDSYYFLTDYIENEQPNYFHLKKDLFLEGTDCNQLISGIVLDKNTKKIAQNSIVQLWYNNQKIKSFETTSDGSYSFNINCNLDYQLRAQKGSKYSKILNFSTSSEKDNNSIQDIFISEKICNQIVQGIVLDTKTKLPIIGAKIELLKEQEEVTNTITNSDGSFSFNLECSTDYKIKAKKNNYNSTITSVASTSKNNSIHKIIELTPINCKQLINGVVIDKKTTLLVPNIQITLIEDNKDVKTVTTNDNGTFSFSLNCGTNYKLKATNHKYQSSSIEFNTNLSRNITLNKTIELNLLDCTQIIQGTVFDNITKLPIAHTQISLLERNSEVQKTSTNSSGVFTLNVNCSSKYTITANHELYKKESINIAINKARNTVNSVSFNLSEKDCEQTVSGIIRNEVTKEPLPNTTITLFEDKNVIDSYTVEDDGIYTFKLKCSSNYKLSVFKNNYLETFKLQTTSQHHRKLTLNIDIAPLVCSQYIYGSVKENISNKPIKNAPVILLNNFKTKLKQTLTDASGEFSFEIECAQKYTVVSKKSTFTEAQIDVFSTNENSLSHTINLVVEPIIQFKEKNGVKYIETKTYLFELDEYEITNQVKSELNKVVFNMNQNPTITIEVNYHTDSRGPDKYNLDLTLNRANSTKGYLVSKGIDPARIFTNGYGETRLLNKCANNVKCTNTAHLINRRVEFIVRKK